MTKAMANVNVLVCLVFACCLAVVSCAGPLCFTCSKVYSTHDCGRIVQCTQNEKCHTKKFIDTTSTAYYTLGCVEKEVCTRNSISIVGKRDTNRISHPKRQASNHLVSMTCCEGNFCNLNVYGTNSTRRMHRCLHCDKVPSPESCDRVVECGEAHLCYVHRGPTSTFAYRYDMGCMPSRQCYAASHVYQNTGCMVCCNSDYCNYDACDNHTAPVTRPYPTNPITITSTATSRTVKTSTAAGHVHGAPTITINMGPTVQAQYSQSVHAKCTSDPGVTIKWGFNDTTIFPHGVRTDSQGDLWIDRLDETNAGVYTCVGVSPSGLLNTKAMTVRIQEIDGQWAPWTHWSTCTVTCGTGNKLRTRSCNDPAPQHNGKPCSGDRMVLDFCNRLACTVDGEWSVWGHWTTCTVSCGTNGMHIRNRACDHPPPQYNGTDCQGIRTEVKDCVGLSPCQSDGQWSPWTHWSTCTATCGTGNKLRMRSCDDPAPQHNGKPCSGDTQEVEVCNQNECTVDGQWSPWTHWSTCTATCGIGNTLRTRSCDDAAPKHNGQQCIGDTKEVDVCNQLACPVDGQWSPWTHWSTCTATCGTGNKLRTRSCDDPAPHHNGQKCTGDNKEVDVCNQFACSVDGQWSAWGTWSMCAATCGTNVDRARTRTCDNPAPLYHGKDCLGDGLDMEHCSVNPCIGTWTDWSHWSTCTATCGPLARRIRVRKCDNPSHGLPCTGSDEETDHCNAPDC